MRILISFLLAFSTGCGGVGLARFDSGASGSAALGVDPEGDIRFGRVSPAIEKSVL